jgi:photosystem II stability/assembly factor-like uncharacterized protein
MRPVLISLILLLFTSVNAHAQRGRGAPAAPADGGPNGLGALHFRPLGPEGNRVASITGVPGDPMTVYIGAADGGIWKTSDAGINWRPIFDDKDVSAVGALAVAQSAHETVWAGTGEPWLIRPYYTLGDGVYKSTDAGRTWQHMGLDATGHIARIIIDPRDANSVYVCAIGQAFRTQRERGVFHTSDGGATWQHVLAVNERTGCSDLAIDSKDPKTLYAGMWELIVHRYDLHSGGPGSGVYVTHDGGATWSKITGHGLPAADHALGKIAVAVSQSNPNRVYALVQDAPAPGLYRSSDRGETWQLVNQSHLPAERAPYYTRMAVSPDDENLLYFPSVAFTMSRDGGTTVFQAGAGGGRGAAGAQGGRGLPPGASAQSGRGAGPGEGVPPPPPSAAINAAPPQGISAPGGDNHDVWIDPTNANRVLVANDSGVAISDNRAASYRHFMLPISQVYHVMADNAVPYNVMGNIQDKSSFRGPSRGGGGRGGMGVGNWVGTGGCEDAFAVPDPVDPDVVWSGCDNGRVVRMDYKHGMARDVSAWPITSYGWAPADMKYRWDWITPIAISPHEHNRVYVGAQVVFMTTNGGQSWKTISPDLTTNDKSHQGNSGGITSDNLTTFDGATLYAIAESPAKAGVIWTGSTDGQVNVTRDAGEHWTNVTKNIPNLPPWGTVWSIAPSKFDAATAYVVENLQHEGLYDALVYKTADYGATWTLISSSLPKGVNSSAHIIVEDPVRKGMLYLGTDNALYVTWDDGARWTRLRNDLPPAPVYWMQVQPTFNDLVIGTHGRGVYILDDVTSLRTWDTSQSEEFHLFAPRPAYRFRSTADGRESEPDAHVQGENPPYGADVDFSLKSATPNVQVSIVGPNNAMIRTLSVAGHPGLNRVWWDLRYDNGSTITMQTPPLYEPWAPARRNYAAYGTRIPPAGPIVPPGKYTIRVKAGAAEQTTTLTVLPDPKSPGTQQSIEAQVAFSRDVLAEIDEVAKMGNALESMRKQSQDLMSSLANDAQKTSLLQSVKTFESNLSAVEAKMIDLRNTGRSEDAFRQPVQLYERISWMIGQMVGTPGGGSGGGDLGPTDQQVAVNNGFKQELAAIATQYRQIADKDVPAMNALLKQNGVAATITAER